MKGLRGGPADRSGHGDTRDRRWRDFAIFLWVEHTLSNLKAEHGVQESSQLKRRYFSLNTSFFTYQLFKLSKTSGVLFCRFLSTEISNNSSPRWVLRALRIADPQAWWLVDSCWLPQQQAWQETGEWEERVGYWLSQVPLRGPILCHRSSHWMAALPLLHHLWAPGATRPSNPRLPLQRCGESFLSSAPCTVFGHFIL